jgi:serpin B
VFNLRHHQQKKLPMMEQSRKFDYRRGSGYQAVRLAYQGWSLGMYVFLPDPGSSPEKLVSIINGDNWQRVTKPGFGRRDGTLVLPKFKLEYSVELNQPLMSLGIKTAFTEKADFSGISDRPLFISEARQKTFVQIDEQGTEAAAVTGIAVPGSALEIDPPKPFEMTVDRPFLFLIEDQETGTILFMGVIYDPGAS